MQGALNCSNCMCARVNELKAEKGDVCVSNRKLIKANFLSREGKISEKNQFSSRCTYTKSVLCVKSGYVINCKSRWKLFRIHGAENNNAKQRKEMCKWREETKKNGKLSLDGRGLAHHAEDEHLIEQLIIGDKQQHYAFLPTDSIN